MFQPVLTSAVHRGQLELEALSEHDQKVLVECGRRLEFAPFQNRGGAQFYKASALPMAGRRLLHSRGRQDECPISKQRRQRSNSVP